jgi:plastocyanin
LEVAVPTLETNRRPRRSTLALTALAVLLLGFWRVYGSAVPLRADAPEAVVIMKDASFSPATVRIKAGQTVTWSNPTTLTHTATGSGFDSGNVGPGGSWSHKFTKAGTYAYVCVPHSAAGMRGAVIVQ